MNILSAETPVHTPDSVPAIRGYPAKIAMDSYYQNNEASEGDAWGHLAWLAALASDKTSAFSSDYTHSHFGRQYALITYRPTSSQVMNKYVHNWACYRNLNYHLARHSSGVAVFGHFLPTGSLMASAMTFNAEGTENWQSLMLSVDRWEKLPDDWDGDDGIAPPKESTSAARRFLNAFARANLPHPSGFVAGDGEIGFRWRTKKGFASISLLGDGTTLAFCRVGLSNIPLRIEGRVDKIDLSPFIESVALIA